jgi:hypothetical protein
MPLFLKSIRAFGIDEGPDNLSQKFWGWQSKDQSHLRFVDKTVSLDAVSGVQGTNRRCFCMNTGGPAFS